MNKVFSYVAIPAADFTRAFTFYDAVTRGSIHTNPDTPFPMAYFVDAENNNVGHLFELDAFRPSVNGTIVYMQLDKDLNDTLTRVTAAGGKIIMPKTLIAPGKGYWAMFLDTEGNKLALHSDE
jgi:uncharacterized protein